MDRTAKQIRKVVNTIFWASLATEEGRYAKLAVVIIEDMEISNGLIFADALAFSASALVKLSPALLVENSHLTVSFDKRGGPVFGDSRKDRGQGSSYAPHLQVT